MQVYRWLYDCIKILTSIDAHRQKNMNPGLLDDNQCIYRMMNITTYEVSYYDFKSPLSLHTYIMRSC
jgi:hypothetical protein